MLKLNKLIRNIPLMAAVIFVNPGYAHDKININEELSILTEIAPNIHKKVLKTALTAYKHATDEGNVSKHILTVIDYSLPSSKKRMWIFDLDHHKMLYNTFVAHGKNSGMAVPKHFSNKNHSLESSIGTFVTKNSYVGSKGYSLNIEGLEKGFNDNAFLRRVVIHGAWYVNKAFIESAGRAGRSWGCPAVATTLARPIINAIKDGSVIFAYYPDKKYLSNSDYVVA